MAIIDPKYSIGIDEMDTQHAHLIRLIDEFRLVSTEQLREPVSIEAAQRALDALLDYTRSHFASEERFMAAHNYPDTVAHTVRHREIEADVLKLQAEIRAQLTTSTPMKLNMLLTIWLLEHILQEDKKYAKFILDKTARAA